MRAPLVSICCTTFNHKDYIGQCLEGFLDQETDFDYEILIHDDASTDGTIEIINEFEKRFPNKIKPLIQEDNQYSKGIKSINPTFNYPRARGKYIALCEGDDRWIDSKKLQRQVDFLEANPDYSLTFTGCRIEKASGEVKVIDYGNEILSYDGENYFSSGVFITTASMLFRRSNLNLYTLPWMLKSFAGDFIIKYCALASGKIAYLPLISCVYNKGVQGSWSARKITMPAVLKEFRDVIRGVNFLRRQGVISEDAYQSKLKQSKAAVYFKKALSLNKINGLCYMFRNIHKTGRFYFLAYLKSLIT